MAQRKACVVLIQNDDGSFAVMDALGQLHQAKTLVELGRACASVLASDDLPEIVTPTALQIHVESAAQKTAEILGRKASAGVRALVPLVSPAIKGVANSVARMRRHDANDRQESRDIETRTSRVARRKRLIAARGAS